MLVRMPVLRRSLRLSIENAMDRRYPFCTFIHGFQIRCFLFSSTMRILLPNFTCTSEPL